MQYKTETHNKYLYHAITTALMILFICGLSVWANASKNIPANKIVKQYNPSNSIWTPIPIEQVAPGNEFIYNNQIYRIDDTGKPRAIKGIDVSKLADADRSYDKTNHRVPNEDDVVRVLDADMKFSHHAKLKDAVINTRICFQGRVYEVKENGYLYDTCIVSSKVIKVFRHTGSNASDTIIDVTIRTKDGKESILHATPNHPFYVPEQNEYVELGKLNPGTKLLTADNNEAVITEINIRKGKFDVYNLEVDGSNNYFVGGQNVLVHNKAMFAKGSNLMKRAGDLVSGGLKRVKGYPSNLENLTYQQILKEAAKGNPGAKLMKKLIEQSPRLKGKGY